MLSRLVIVPSHAADAACAAYAAQATRVAPQACGIFLRGSQLNYCICSIPFNNCAPTYARCRVCKIYSICSIWHTCRTCRLYHLSCGLAVGFLFAGPLSPRRVRQPIKLLSFKENALALRGHQFRTMFLGLSDLALSVYLTTKVVCCINDNRCFNPSSRCLKS